MTISLIWAQSANGVIGADGALPWQIAEDLARFRQLTTGATVVMGRRTWESLPSRFRPLPGRRNIVLSRDPSYIADGAEVVSSLSEALSGGDEIWVIGGAAVYEAALAEADRLFITDVDVVVDGDVRAPMVGAQWVETDRDPRDGWHMSQTGLSYRWRALARTG
ncbi:MAG: dihydrofolate reductase [Frankiaceae bacterium]|nr:dihydrofolate reductase [Frankiaceae bacterium]